MTYKQIEKLVGALNDKALRSLIAQANAELHRRNIQASEAAQDAHRAGRLPAAPQKEHNMKMSSGFQVIAEGCSGRQYGHVPGHQYHDVEVGVGSKGSQYRAVVLETWGSAQGYDEEHGRRKVAARGTDPRDCLAECVARAHAAGIEGEYLPQALSECEDALEDALASAAATA
jgi:hypothetical protein